MFHVVLIIYDSQYLAQLFMMKAMYSWFWNEFSLGEFYVHILKTDSFELWMNLYFSN